MADYAKYETLTCREQTHARAFTALAKTGRMTLGDVMEQQYLTEAIDHWHPREILETQQQRGRAFMVFQLQKLFSTSMQATFVGVSSNLAKVAGLQAGADTFTLVTVGLSSIMGLDQISCEVSRSHALYKKIRESCEERMQKQGVSKQEINLLDRTLWWSRLDFLVTLTFGLWSFAVLAWCVTKAVMAIFCPCGMWNFSSHILWPLNWLDPKMFSTLGCVSFANASFANQTGEECASPFNIPLYVHEPVAFINASGPWCSVLFWG